MLLHEAIVPLAGIAVKCLCGGSKRTELSLIMNRWIGSFSPHIYVWSILPAKTELTAPPIKYHWTRPTRAEVSDFVTQLLSGILKSRKKIPLHVNLSSRRQFHCFIQSCISISVHLLQLCNAPEFTDSFKMKICHISRGNISTGIR